MNILVTSDPNPAFDRLPRGINVRFGGITPAGVDAAMGDDIEVLLADVMPSSDRASAGLKWIQLLSAGTGQLVGHPLVRPGVALSGASGTNAVAVAEFLVARVLYHTKHFAEYERLQRKRRWAEDRPAPRPTLRRTRVVIVGYGAIGREAARLFDAHGAALVVVDEKPRRLPFRGYLPEPGLGDPRARLPERVITAAGLPGAVRDADALVVCVPLSDATRGMVNAKVLAAMKPEAILVNAARGPVVKTAALLKALDRGRPGHAYLDVFDEEPLTRRSRLWRHPRVSITPHSAAAASDNMGNVRDLFLANLKRYRSGRPLINALDPADFRKP